MQNEQLETALTTPGSTLYYALQRVPDSQRIPCLGLFCLYKELRGLVFSKSETVYVQLGWWYEELGRMLAGRSRHPVTQAISTWQDCSQARPLDWLTTLEPLLGVSRFNDEPELLAFCSTLSAPLRAAYHCLGAVEAGESSAVSEFITDASVAYILFDFVQNLGQYLRDGVVPIPRSELDSSCIQASDLLRSNKTPEFLNVMQLQYNRVSTALSNAPSKLSASETPKQHVALTVAAIHRTVLKEIQNSNYDVVDNCIDITPFRKAWIAWRTYREAIRDRSA